MITIGMRPTTFLKILASRRTRGAVDIVMGRIVIKDFILICTHGITLISRFSTQLEMMDHLAEPMEASGHLQRQKIALP